MSAMSEINSYLLLKPSSVGDPDIYLGTKLKQTPLPNGVMVWGLSPLKYVVQAVKICQVHLTDKLNGKYSIPTRADNPFPVDYNPSTDLSDILNPECSSFYQHLIGVVRWMVELGRIDIATEVSMLSSNLPCPREGHLENALHVMGYLRLKHNSRLIFDPTYPDIDQTAFPSFEWMEFYGNVEEAIPPNMPPPLGKDVDLCMMVDSDHAGEKRTQRSRTGFIIFCNLAPIIWLSKQQATIETSVFGAEFVAMKHGIKMLRGLRCKIRMMGIPLSGPMYIYCDNKSQVTNSSRPESTLEKKCNSICYHAIRESVAMGETLPMYIRTGENLADFLTKTTSGAKRHKLVSGVVHDIYNDFPKQ
jgi:hypothetical protein